MSWDQRRRLHRPPTKKIYKQVGGKKNRPLLLAALKEHGWKETGYIRDHIRFYSEATDRYILLSGETYFDGHYFYRCMRRITRVVDGYMWTDDGILLQFKHTQDPGKRRPTRNQLQSREDMGVILDDDGER